MKKIDDFLLGMACVVFIYGGMFLFIEAVGCLLGKLSPHLRLYWYLFAAAGIVVMFNWDEIEGGADAEENPETVQDRSGKVGEERRVQETVRAADDGKV